VRELQESPQKVEKEPESAEPRSVAGGAQEGAQKPQEKRSWWRRLIGG